MKRTPLVTTIQSALFITDNPETSGRPRPAPVADIEPDDDDLNELNYLSGVTRKD